MPKKSVNYCFQSSAKLEDSILHNHPGIPHFGTIFNQLQFQLNTTWIYAITEWGEHDGHAEMKDKLLLQNSDQNDWGQYFQYIM